MVINAEPPLRLCVEVSVEDPAWIEHLPPAPANHDVRISFDSARFVARDQQAVTELGYPCVGVGVVTHTSDVAHLLVPIDVVTSHPRWWRALLDLARRVYDLRFGPVQIALRDVLARHHDPQQGRSTGTTRNGRAANIPLIPGRGHPTV